MATDVGPILNYLYQQRGLDFSGYHPPMLVRRIAQRLGATGCADLGDYLVRLRRDGAELDCLLDVLTINVSRFFRDTLTFELIADRILPPLILEKTRQGDHSLRIWSAGCAGGEEPYSVAILIHELLRKERRAMHPLLFATDIDAKALRFAAEAVYPFSSIKNIKYRLLTQYFAPDGDGFRLSPEIRGTVAFSRYDMLDKKHRVPPESIYGSFDLVLCRNLLIYYNHAYQDAIFDRLYHALAPEGRLVLGEAEAPTENYRRHFGRMVDASPIYRKR